MNAVYLRFVCKLPPPASSSSCVPLLLLLLLLQLVMPVVSQYCCYYLSSDNNSNAIALNWRRYYVQYLLTTICVLLLLFCFGFSHLFILTFVSAQMGPAKNFIQQQFNSMSGAFDMVLWISEIIIVPFLFCRSK